MKMVKHEGRDVGRTRKWPTSLAAAFRTDWIEERRTFGRPTRRELQ